MKILLTLQYNGTNFIGWQKQINGRSIQGELEKSLSFLLDDNIKIYGSGRTDAKVHAIGQTAHFETNSFKINNFLKKGKLIKTSFINALNANLPEDIYITNATLVNNNFHARYDVKEKVYEYHLQIGKNPLNNNLCGKINSKLCMPLMKEASKYLVGEHDFSSFCSSKTATANHIRTIKYIKIYSIKNNEIIFEISGNGFLYNMVRIIVGSLVNVGLKKIQPIDIKNILDKKNRIFAGKTMQPEGLYLKKVIY